MHLGNYKMAEIEEFIKIVELMLSVIDMQQQIIGCLAIFLQCTSQPPLFKLINRTKIPADFLLVGKKQNT